MEPQHQPWPVLLPRLHLMPHFDLEVERVSSKRTCTVAFVRVVTASTKTANCSGMYDIQLYWLTKPMLYRLMKSIKTSVSLDLDTVS